MNLKMKSAEVVYPKYLLTSSTEANSVDPDKTASIGAVWSGSTLLELDANKTFRQTTKSDVVIGTLRVNPFQPAYW